MHRGAAAAGECAEYMQSKRVNDGTKKNFKSRINVMTRWMMQHVSNALTSDNQIKIPKKKDAPTKREYHQYLEEQNVLKDAVIKFFGELSMRAFALEGVSSRVAKSLPKPLAPSSLWGYRSALVYLHSQTKQTLDEKLNVELDTLLNGYEKTICALQKEGKVKPNEGKMHLKWDGYDMLAEKFFKKSPPPGAKGYSWSTTVFAWSFCVLMWNLMSRSESVDSLMMEHVDWDGDALTIEEQGHKGDQTGECKYPKHLYANTEYPYKCAVLAFAVQFFSFPDRPNESYQIFAGTNSKNRFSHLLAAMLTSLDANEKQRLGCPVKEIGTHSLRKGSGTYALGQVCGPTPVSVFLRMGQSLGQLKDRYIHSSEGADQLCGRMVAGLPFNSMKFATLPPHFTKQVTRQLTETFWKEAVSGYDDYPTGMKTALPYLLASVIHHEQYLRDNLHESHPIFSSRAFHNSLIDILRGSTLCGVGVCEETDMKATGIPPHLALAEEIRQLKNKQKAFIEQLDRLEKYMKGELSKELAVHVAEEIHENFIIEGAAPISMRAIDNRLDALEESILSKLQLSTNPSSSTVVEEQSEPTWNTWYWGDGRFCHFVPPGWEFSNRLSVKRLWELWWQGDRSLGIKPFSQINFTHELKEDRIKMRCSRAGAVMAYCTALATRLQLLPNGTDICRLSVGKKDDVFAQLLPVAIEELYQGKKSPGRPMEICYGTIYNKLPRSRKRKRS